jgi:hypothetical protein
MPVTVLLRPVPHHHHLFVIASHSTCLLVALLTCDVTTRSHRTGTEGLHSWSGFLDDAAGLLAISPPKRFIICSRAPYLMRFGLVSCDQCSRVR